MKKTRFILSAVAIMVGTLGALATTALEKKDTLAVVVTDVLGECDPIGNCTGSGDPCTRINNDDPLFELVGLCQTPAEGDWIP